MMPVYMNSSQPSQARPQGHYHQGFGNYPHLMPMDASSPVSCEHCQPPSPCFGSFVHGNFPAYNAYWSPCCPPQVPYHPCSMNYYGFHPHASHAPPCYVHQPWLDSDRDAAGKHHCAKCSPRMCHPKTDRSVVIEEHEPEKGDHGDAVKPVHSTNCPYPVIWIPHEDARNQEYRGSPESGSRERSSAEVKVPRCTEIQKRDPKSWNGRFPLDENIMKSLIHNLNRGELKNGVELPFDVSKLKFVLPGQEGKEAQIEKNKEPGQLSYPVFWIPSHGKQEDVTASENRERSNEGPNSNSKSIPSNVHTNEGQIIQHSGKEGNIDCKVSSDAEEKSFMRNIPVENHQQAPRNIPVKLLENHLPKPTEPTKSTTKTEPIEKKKKEQPASPPKASRLPPVCLRVDPLPKRKNGRKNGGSNSPSPPRRNEQRLTSKDTEVTSPLSSKKAETRTVAEPYTFKGEEAKNENMMSERRLTVAATEKESVESKANLQEGANCEIVEHCDTEVNREKLERKTFTEDEAARMIQSAYRGYDVRRWEPLKKLKDIAAVREQMGDVKKRIQGLEVSSDQCIEEKEIIILGEVVMSLLLKLDAVQGLHPSIKDHRKSLARELSDIQEKLDSMRKSSSIAEEGAVKEQVAITSQTGVSPADLEHPQLTVENKMVMHPDTEKVPLALSGIDEKLGAEAEEGTGSSETLAMDLESSTDTDICEVVPTLTTVPEKVGEVETVLPINLQSADGEGESKEDKAVDETLGELPHELPQVVAGQDATEVSEAEANATSEEDKAVVESLEELPHELPQVVAGLNATEVSEAEANATSEEDKAVVESLEELSLELPQVVEGLNATEISEVETNASENEDLKGDEEAVLPLEKDVKLSELPIGVIDDGIQVLSQDSSSCSREEKPTPMDPETEASSLENLDIKEEYDTLLSTEKDVEISELPGDEMQLLSQDSSTCTVEMKKTAIDIETANQEESDSNHFADISKGIDQESCEPQEDKEHAIEESEVMEHELPEEAKRLMEENQHFKEMMETLVKARREQLEVISKLTGRVKTLEKKLSQKKRVQFRRRKPCRGKARYQTNV